MKMMSRKQKIFLNLLGSAIQAFGLYHVHAASGVTEGGILGLMLLLHNWFGISPAWSSLILNAACYLLGWRVLGLSFIKYSILAGGSFSVFYSIVERFPPLWPGLAQMPLLAAVAGALFVGVGVGLCVRTGGAPGGDDALAMSLNRLLKWDIRWFYLIGDLVVLLLSLTYLPPARVAVSLVTVLLSGQIIGWIQQIGVKNRP